jgi:hypothetical protein
VRESLRTLVRRVRETWAATGVQLPVVAAIWLVQREYLVTARTVDLETRPPPRSGALWRQIEDPTQRLIRSAPFMGERAEIQRRLDEGQECWVAWVDGQPAHWRWETSKPVFLRYLGKSLRLQSGDLGVVDVYTAPRFRGRGLHTEGTFLALERARTRGLTRLIGLVAWWNDPARRVVEVKTGRRLVGSVGYWRLGPTRRYFARGRVRLEPDGIVVPPEYLEQARPPGFGAARRPADR